MINLGAIDIVIIVLYIIFIVWWGLRNGKSHDAGAYFLAGRSMPWWVIGLSLFAASISSTTLIGQSGDAYHTGIAVFNYNLAGGEIYINVAGSGVMIPTHDGWGEYQTTAGFYDAFEPGDLRKDHLICKEVYDAEGNVTKSYPGGGLSYPFSLKFIDSKHVGDKTSTRPFLLRYSDVALMYAEATAPRPSMTITSNLP